MNSFVLIPRVDTEIIIEQVLKKINNFSLKILDLGTGSGAIAIALSYECPKCYVIGIDNNFFSLMVAKKNALSLKLLNIFFLYSNWFSELHKKKFHIIVSNPPYLSFLDFKKLYSNLLYEPYFSLVSGNSGLEHIKYIIKQSPKFLYNNGWLFLEHDYKQTKIIQYFFKKYNFFSIKSYRDYNGYYRVTCGKYVY